MDASNVLNINQYKPTIKDTHVSREALYIKINESLKKERNIILVSAEAGYGKTNLVAGWLNRHAQCNTWLCLDEYCNDPISFLNYIVFAFRKVNKTFGDMIENLMSTPKLPKVEIISSYIIKEIAEIKENIVVIFDDYHIITNPYIHKLMQRLLDSKLHNILPIIITRQDPPFTLPRWRASDRLTEIRSFDLRFETDEIKEFFSKNFHVKLEADTLNMLENRTEGWAAGLQLIGLSFMNFIQEQGDRELIEQFTGNNRFIADYLMEEVFEKQEAHIRTFLKITSILRIFNEELCNTVTGLNNSKQILERLEKENLFLAPIDGKRDWYRYHNLFSEFLSMRLDKGLKMEICRKASAWYKTNGFIELAFEYALESGDGELMLSMVNQLCSKYLFNGRIEKVLEHLNSIKKTINRIDVEVETIRAWCLFLLGEREKACKVLKELKGVQEIKESSMLGKIKALEAIIYTNIDKSEALMLAEEAVSILKDDNKIFYNIALRTLGLVKISEGVIDEACIAFKKIIDGVDSKNYRLIEMSAFVTYIDCLITMGKKKYAQSLCEKFLDEYKDQHGNLLPMAKMVYLPLGICLYIGNDLKRAKEYLCEGINFCREMKLISTIGNAEGIYVKLLYILGDKYAALKTLLKYKSLAKSSGLENTFAMLEAIEIDLCLKEKNNKMVSEWMQERREIISDNRRLVSCSTKLTYVRALLDAKKYSEAETILLEEEEFARKSQKYEQLITILILSALVKKYNGAEKKALTYISEALRLAEPEGYIRNFLDEGSEVLELVHSVNHVSPKIVNVLEKNNGLKATIEPLKEKEFEILKLISIGMSNAEIAQNLYITTGTTKWYINNIFAKLGVNKRTQAVEKARQYGIIN